MKYYPVDNWCLDSFHDQDVVDLFGYCPTCGNRGCMGPGLVAVEGVLIEDPEAAKRRLRDFLEFYMGEGFTRTIYDLGEKLFNAAVGRDSDAEYYQAHKDDADEWGEPE